jgi:hypothetical protein
MSKKLRDTKNGESFSFSFRFRCASLFRSMERPKKEKKRDKNEFLESCSAKNEKEILATICVP